MRYRPHVTPRYAQHMSRRHAFVRYCVEELILRGWLEPESDLIDLSGDALRPLTHQRRRTPVGLDQQAEPAREPAQWTSEADVVDAA